MSEIKRFTGENWQDADLSKMLSICFATLPKYGESHSVDRLRGWIISLEGENVTGEEIKHFTAFWMKNGTRIPIPADFFDWRYRVEQERKREEAEGMMMLRMATEAEKIRQRREEAEQEQKASEERERLEAESKGMTVAELRQSRMDEIRERVNRAFGNVPEHAKSRYASKGIDSIPDLIITDQDRSRLDEQKRRLRETEGESGI